MKNIQKSLSEIEKIKRAQQSIYELLEELKTGQINMMSGINANNNDINGLYFYLCFVFFIFGLYNGSRYENDRR